MSKWRRSKKKGKIFLFGFITIILISVFVELLNSDTSGRSIENIYSPKFNNKNISNNLPKITTIFHEHNLEANSVGYNGLICATLFGQTVPGLSV